MYRGPLAKEDVRKAVERDYPSATPLVFHKWWGEGLGAKYGNALNEMAKPFPDDILFTRVRLPR